MLTQISDGNNDNNKNHDHNRTTQNHLHKQMKQNKNHKNKVDKVILLHIYIEPRYSLWPVIKQLFQYTLYIQQVFSVHSIYIYNKYFQYIFTTHRASWYAFFNKGLNNQKNKMEQLR